MLSLFDELLRRGEINGFFKDKARVYSSLAEPDLAKLKAGHVSLHLGSSSACGSAHSAKLSSSSASLRLEPRLSLSKFHWRLIPNLGYSMALLL